MGPWLMPLLSIGGSIFGTMLQNRAARRQAKAQNRRSHLNDRRANQVAAANAAAADAAAKVTADRANEAAKHPILQPAPGMDLAKLRADAIRNGFNPLTVLGATGGQGYSMSFADMAYASKAYAQQTYSGRVVSQPASALAAGFQSASDLAQQYVQGDIQQALDAAQFGQQKQLQDERLKAEAAIYGNRAAFVKPVPYDALVTQKVIVTDGYGKQMELTGDQAERLGVGPGAKLTIGETEQLMGQVYGPVGTGLETVGKELGAIDAAGGGVMSWLWGGGNGASLSTGSVVPVLPPPGVVTRPAPALSDTQPLDPMGGYWGQ